MTSVGVHEAKTNLSDLLRRAEAGEEVVICRGSVPVARLVAVAPPGRRTFGTDRGLFVVPEDFDAPLPDDVLDDFYSVRLVVDTHAWLWLQVEPERLPASVLDLLEDPENEVFVSAASAWEIAVKFQQGRLPLPEAPMTYVPTRMADSGFKPLSVEHVHALRAGQLPMHHRDPFDRLLVAQCQSLGLPLISRDPVFAAYEVDILWN